MLQKQSPFCENGQGPTLQLCGHFSLGIKVPIHGRKMHGMGDWKRAGSWPGGGRRSKQWPRQSVPVPTIPIAAPMLDESVIIQLVEMGFPMDACRKAVYYTGNSGAEAAMNWVMSHMDDPGSLGWGAGWGRASILPQTNQPLHIHRFCEPPHPAWV